MNTTTGLKACFLATLACLLFAGSVQAQAPGDFETQEYRNSTGLWVINAAEAYSRGYTGKGITLGIIDDGVNREHFELQGKNVIWVPCEGYVTDWTVKIHGSHVAGIMAANRDGADIPGNMHGVAFDADLLAMGTFLDGVHEDPMRELIKEVLIRPDVKIVNNSWSDSQYYLDTLFEARDDAERAKSLDELRNTLSKYAADAFLENLAEQGKLMVFAAGNFGHRGPSIPASFPSFVPRLNNWLNVVALDSTAGRISVAGDGKTRLLSDSAVPTYSDLAMGAEEYTLVAPGTWINSVDSTSGYREMSGTSMAAPYVSGTLGLVQQAFPWMSARQLADTVLSTADRNFSAPKTVLSLAVDTVRDSNTGNELSKIKIRLQLVDVAGGYQNRNQTEGTVPSAGTPERTRLEAYLRNYYQENETHVYESYGLKDTDEFLAAFFATEDTPYEIRLPDGSLYATTSGSVWSVPFDQIFGQGIVDAGKAVDGPSQLNANRMSPSDLADERIRVYTGKEELLYAVDTKGFVSAWNNDISQELWHAERHTYVMPEFLQENPYYLDTMKRQTSVGFLKNGEGTLYLTGTNSYTGSTVIEGGTLSISRRADFSGGQLTASDVYVLPEGCLQGNGVIHRDVFNWGTVAPGNSIGALTVNGNYAQSPSGVLAVEFDGAGHADTLRVQGNAAVAGILAFTPVRDFYSGSLKLTPLDVSGTLEQLYSTRTVFASPTLTFGASPQSDQTVLVSVTREPDAYSRYADSDAGAALGRVLARKATSGLSGDMQNMLVTLDFSNPNGTDVRTGLTALSPDVYGNGVAANFDMHRMLTDLLLVNTGLHGARPAASFPDGEWRTFVLPFAGYATRSAHDGLGGFDASHVGLIGGAERVTAGGLLIGGHVVFNHQNMDNERSGRLRGEGLYLGAQGRYAPESWSGWNVFGVGRVGMEMTRAKRDVAILDYQRSNSADWTGYSGTVQSGIGYDHDFESFSAGAFAALDYAFMALPSFTEKDGAGSRLHLSAETFQSLRSSVGTRMSTTPSTLGERATWKVQGSMAWNHELLDKTGTLRASFADVTHSGFTQRVELPGKDSLGLGAALIIDTDCDLSFSLNAGSELANGGSSLYGNLAVGWKF